MVGAGEATPALVENVETLANVAHILARGASWYRTEGTDESPGTIVCTVTGAVERAGVGEVIMGTPLREVLETGLEVRVPLTTLRKMPLGGVVFLAAIFVIWSGLCVRGFRSYGRRRSMGQWTSSPGRKYPSLPMTGFLSASCFAEYTSAKSSFTRYLPFSNGQVNPVMEYRSER